MSGNEYERPKTRNNGRRPGHDKRTRSHQGQSSQKHSSLNERKLAGDSYQGRASFTATTIELVNKKTKTKVEGGVTLYKCALTGKFYPRDQMQIDHIRNWEDYGTSGASGGLTSSGQVTKEAMKKAYNDIRNLQLVLGGVNASKGKRSRPKRNYLESVS